jgi:hypothetical protein
MFSLSLSLSHTHTPARARTSDVATAVDEREEGGTDQSFFSGSEEQTKAENSYIPRVYNNGNRTWETMVIPSQI